MEAAVEVDALIQHINEPLAEARDAVPDEGIDGLLGRDMALIHGTDHVHERLDPLMIHVVAVSRATEASGMGHETISEVLKVSIRRWIVQVQGQEHSLSGERRG